MVIPTSRKNAIDIIKQDELFEYILESTPPKYRELLSAIDVYNYFPEFVIIKDEIEVLPFQYTDGEYDVDLLITLVKTVSVTGFEYTIGITELDKQNNYYDTNFRKIPSLSFPKFLEELLQEKNIDFINYSVMKKIRNILNSNE